MVIDILLNVKQIKQNEEPCVQHIPFYVKRKKTKQRAIHRYNLHVQTITEPGLGRELICLVIHLLLYVNNITMKFLI